MKATSHHSTLMLNPSNHPSVPAEGLVLEAGKATPVPAALGSYLRTLGVEVEDGRPATPRLAAPAAEE